jgi:Lrp/AsnC family leucine-responsive transcriptional regulator
MELDDIDAEILRLLAADARRPYREVAEAVDRSAPTVSDRVDRLQELGVIRRFTVDVDRSKLHSGVPVLVTVTPETGADEAVFADLAGAEQVEHAFRTADARVIVQADVPEGAVAAFLAEVTDRDRIREFEVTLLTDAEWTPAVEGAGFALDCAECGNTVTAEGETTRIDGTLYSFCCDSCRERFEGRYADLKEGA